MALISELLSLPRTVNRGDFVLRLSEGITDAHAEATLHDYVVTPQLAANFRDALHFIRGAVEANSSKGAYLHGSFGSGKSHFMAVLYLLLRGSSKARALPELSEVVQAQDRWTEGRKFLLVPYHMIGAHSMESAILGQYVDFVRRLHPEAPTPGVYLSESLFDDARRLRAAMGDESFLAALNQGRAGGEGGWGNIGASWDAARFDAAVVAPEDAEDRIRLVGDLTDTLFQAYAGIAAGQGRGFVGIDRGLSIISRHAQSLGYDAVILFLDELILWLASHAADTAFLSDEGPKLAKLVEAQDPSRPIPIVSFVARQRDIRDLVGEQSIGAHALAFNDVFRWWEARFHLITLEDRNLPAIAAKRVLAPKDAAAKAEIDAAFAQTSRIRADARQAMLTDASEEQFRQVYPFSPALVQILVAVSSMLQRERTALKVMLQLLVRQRDTLQLGDLVAVGDLFDVISEGDEAFNEQMREYFDGARRLWTTKLRPILEAEHGIGEEQLETRAWNDPQASAYRADARLLKTLLLGALVPNVDALRALDARRLGALNHGTFRSPIPGQEDALILTRLRKWAAQVGEIHISDDPRNPTIALQITGVDVDAILRQASAEDNPGNRLRKIRSVVFKLCDIEDKDTLFLSHDVHWRGTKRSIEVRFSNVRDLPLDSLRARGADWLLVIDFPFDEQGRSPADDRAKVQDFRATQDPSTTIVWIPAFLSASSLTDLKNLILIDHVLAGDRLVAYTTHLTLQERDSARVLLENQRSQLDAKLRAILEGAYGVGKEPDGAINTALEHPLADRFQSLDPTMRMQPPVGPSMADALSQLVSQGLDHQFPSHPRFEVEEVRPALLKRVYAEVQKAITEPNRRLFVEGADTRRLMRQVAVPLQLGEQGEQHFVLKDTWVQHFDRKLAEEGGPLHARRLRKWMDEPAPRGLQSEVANLVILAYAEQKNLRFLLHGGPASPTIDSLHDDLELREIDLPSPSEWAEAKTRANKVFGKPLLEQRTASNVSHAATLVQEAARSLRPAAAQLVEVLKARVTALEISADGALRLRTARAALTLVAAIEQAPSDKVVATLAATPVDVDLATIGSSLKTAEGVAASLRHATWPVLMPAMGLQDARRAEAQRLRELVVSSIRADEYVIPLAPALVEAQTVAAALLARSVAQPEPPEVTVPGGAIRRRRAGLSVADARQVLDSLSPEQTDVSVTIEWTEKAKVPEREGTPS